MNDFQAEILSVRVSRVRPVRDASMRADKSDM